MPAPAGRGHSRLVRTRASFRETLITCGSLFWSEGEKMSQENAQVHFTLPGERLLFHYAERFLFQEVPAGTRVVYAPPPLPPIENVKAAALQAIENPHGRPPLSALLKPGMKVTIAFDDLSIPLPPMKRPDLRQLLLEVVIDKLAEKGVTDVHLIVATGLHRRMTGPEIRRIVGRRIFDAFYPERLYNHDAEDPEGVEHLGTTERGEIVEINRRAATSDLLIYVNINLSAMDGGNKSILTGLPTYRSVKSHHNVHALMHSTSYMHPPSSEIHHVLNRMGAILEEHVNIFHIETTLNTQTFSPLMSFLQTPEPKHSTWERANFHFSRGALNLLPFSLNRRIFMKIPSPYGMTSIQAGSNDLVHPLTLANIHRQQVVEVNGQTDILLAGVPYIGPYNVNSLMNPILIVNLAAGYLFNLYIGKPLVRRGGVMILFHPLQKLFHPGHHPSYIDFYDKVLPVTRDAATMERDFETEFAHDRRYIDLYRHGHAYHGVHPFYMWYWGCYAIDYLNKIIVVQAKDQEVAQRLGFDTARNLNEALEMARSALGKPDPSITQFHWPPLFMCRVNGD